jgi:proteic killer suppression protein
MTTNDRRIPGEMIANIKHRGLRRFDERDDRSRLPQAHIARIERILDRLNVAVHPNSMDIAGFGLHPLKGNFEGF